MIKAENGTVEFTGINYDLAKRLGIPKDVLEQTQAEILTHDLSILLEGIASKLGRVATVQILEDAVKLSLDPRTVPHDNNIEEEES